MNCLRLIYNTYKTELSFGVDKEVVISDLENYFDSESNSDIEFDENEEILKDSRSKAVGILRSLKNSGWIEYETSSDYKVKVNLFDYAATMIESFNKIIKNEDIEIQSMVSQISATISNKEAHAKPYEYIIRRVTENTEELMVGLKKLSTSIKKRIDAMTHDKDANEILRDFFIYQEEIGSKAYHNIKTKDNISYFRSSIIDGLYNILEDNDIFARAVSGYMSINKVTDRVLADDALKEQILQIISAFRNYDEIIGEIDDKNARYIARAVERAKFLLTNSNNAEGKISKILAFLVDEYNNDETINLNDEAGSLLFQVVNMFPQNFIDNDSLDVIRITKKMCLPEKVSSLGLSAEERESRKLALQEKNRNRFSRININEYTEKLLGENKIMLASSLPLKVKRDLIRVIYTNLYGRNNKSTYRTKPTDTIIAVDKFRFHDFIIERRE